ncbi:MAG TPA: hypothetical protein P5159_04580 [Phycisphaerae bacterium]|nr:hypothetical protein [Phycisphaerae bacterium]
MMSKRSQPVLGRRAGRSALLAALVTSAAMAADVREKPSQIGSRLTLFLDRELIAGMKHAALRLHSPIPRGVVFAFDQAWEGGQSAYVTVLKDGRRFRMYYRGGGDLGRECTCMAESDDGIHWVRPKLGLFEHAGSKDNNIVWTGRWKAYDECHNFSPFIDSNPAAGPEERYKAVTLARPGEGEQKRNVLVAFVSADGIHWRRLQDAPIITDGAFDSHNTAFWDVARRQYVCFLRASQQGKKSIARTTSPDFVHWGKSELLSFGDTPIEHFYTNGIVTYFRAPEVYLGFPMRFIHPRDRDTIGFKPRKTDGFSDAVFMSSRDGRHWDRTFMEAMIRPGLDPKNWGGAHGNSTPSWGIVQTGDTELSIYWAEHYDNYPAEEIMPRLQRGTFRLDGFISVNAPYAGGEMVTRPLVFSGSSLAINYSTSAPGSVKVEIQDAEGLPIPDFALDDCLAIWGDEIERTVAWKKGSDVSALAGTPVRLRFVMVDADLYSIRFRP